MSASVSPRPLLVMAGLVPAIHAVPLAPLAKDLTSGLSAAMQALKAAKGS